MKGQSLNECGQKRSNSLEVAMMRGLSQDLAKRRSFFVLPVLAAVGLFAVANIAEARGTFPNRVLTIDGVPVTLGNDGLTPFEIDAQDCTAATGGIDAACNLDQEGVSDFLNTYPATTTTYIGSGYPAGSHTNTTSGVVGGLNIPRSGTSGTIVQLIDGGLDGCYDPNDPNNALELIFSDIADGTTAVVPDTTSYESNPAQNDNPWPLPDDVPPSQSKTDFCALWEAAEIVRVTETDGAGTVTRDQNETILYVGAEINYDATGDKSTLIPLFSPLDKTRVGGEKVIEIDINSNGTSAIAAKIWNQTTESWELLAAANDANADCVLRPNLRYAECALNLTLLGVLPEDECATVEIPGSISRTGNSANAVMKDVLLLPDPITFTNCGPTQVAKVSSPPDLISAVNFDYVLNQLDGKPVHSPLGTLVVDGGLDVSGVNNTTEPDSDVAEVHASIQIGQTDTWGNIIGEPDYQLVELPPLPAGWELESIVCTTTDLFSVGFPPVDVIIYENGAYTDNVFLVPPDTIDKTLGLVDLPTPICTITNATSGVVVEKVGVGNPAQAFPFTITDPANPAGTISTQVAGVDSGLILGQSSDVIAYTPGASVMITETLPGILPGWSLDSISCVGSTSGAITPTASTPASVTFTTLAGEAITCTFTNTQNGQINVLKAGAPTGAGPFGFDTNYADNTAAPDGAEDFALIISGTADNSGDLAPGDYTIVELLAATNITANPDFVLDSISCEITTPGAGTSSFSYGADNALVTLASGDIVDCTFTNTQNGRIIVDKVTTPFGDGIFTFTGNVAGSITTVGGVTPAMGTLVLDVAPGTYTSTEATPTQFTLTDITCVDPTSDSAVDLPTSTATFEVSAGETITCTFTNTRNSAQFTLAKVWVNGITGDTVDLDADTNEVANTGIIDANSVAPTGSSSAMTVYAGETIDFSEGFTVGEESNYSTFLVCTDTSGELLNVADQYSGQLIVADSPSDITCTFSNTQIDTNVTLTKEWVDGIAGDELDLTITGGTGSVAAVDGDSAVSGATNIATATAIVGDTVVLTEAFTTGDDANYTTTLVCLTPENDVVYTADAVTGSVEIDVADVGGTIACTFSNTQIDTNVTLTKEWVDGIAGDELDLTITGGTGSVAAVDGDSAVSGATNIATATALVGDTVVLTEAFTTGDDANYTTTLVCLTPANDVVYTADAVTGSVEIDVADVGGTIACTFSNTQIDTNVTLTKEWVDGIAGDELDLTITGGTGSVAAVDGDSAVSGATNIATATALVGDTVVLTEAFTTGDDANYTTTLVCLTPANDVVYTADAVTGSVEIDVADVGGTIACTFSNMRKRTTLKLQKLWIDATAGDIADLSVMATNSHGPIAAVAPGGTAPSPEFATITVFAGETATLTEVITPISVEAVYEVRDFTCDSSTGTVAWVNGAATATLDVLADDTTEPITCTFMNMQILPAIELTKTFTADSPIEIGVHTYTAIFDLLVTNTGNVPLDNVQITDNLIDMINTPHPNFATVSGPFTVVNTSGSPLTTNNGVYNGDANVDLLAADQVLPVGATSTITVSFTLNLDVYFGPFDNYATVTGIYCPEGKPALALAPRPFSALCDEGIEVEDTDNDLMEMLGIPVTPITLGWLKTSDMGDGEVLFEWVTETEVANVGFTLWSMGSNGQWIQLNDVLILSQGDSLGTQHYKYLASDVEGTEFRITDLGVTGKQEHHGPYDLGQTYGVQTDPKATDWDQIEREGKRKQQMREQQHQEDLERRMRLPQNQQSRLGSPPTNGMIGRLLGVVMGAFIAPAEATELLNFGVESAGIYRVTHDQLMDKGVNLSSIPIAQVGLKSGNQLVPIKLRLSEGGAFDASSWIEFTGEGKDTLYTGINQYTLVLGEGQVLITSDDRGLPEGPVAYSYLAEKTYAPQNGYTHHSPDRHDPWYADRLRAIDGPAQKTVDLYLDDHAPAYSVSGGSQNADQLAAVKPRLEVNLWGASALPGNGLTNPDHHVQIDLNGTQVADERFDGIRVYTVKKPLSQLKSGGNRIKVTVPKDHGYQFDLMHLDRVTLSYPRHFKAEEGGESLVFPSAWNKFRVRGLSQQEATVYRVDGPGATSEMSTKEGECYGAEVGCIVTFAGGSGGADSVYYVSTGEGIKTPTISVAPAYEDLFTGNAAHLVIAHPDFIGTANGSLEVYASELAAIYGSSDLVSVDSIYAQYSGHVLAAESIQAYIKEAYSRRGTRQVTLVGGDMFDYRDNLNSGARSFVPSLYVRIGVNLNAVPSDSKYGDLDDDNIPDLAITRLPVRTEVELERLLNKRTRYLARDNHRDAVFAADKADDGYSFKSDSQALIASHFGDWDEVATAYIDDAGVADAKATLVSEINAGVSLTSYIGHSGTNYWSQDGLILGDEIAGLTNTQSPTVVAQWGCWNTFYVDPVNESMVQRFLLENDQGAVTVMGATSLTNADSEKALADLLYARLNDGMSIGAAVLSAKRKFAESNPYQYDILLGWATLGPMDMVVNNAH